MTEKSCFIRSTPSRDSPSSSPARQVLFLLLDTAVEGVPSTRDFVASDIAYVFVPSNLSPGLCRVLWGCSQLRSASRTLANQAPSASLRHQSRGKTAWQIRVLLYPTLQGLASSDAACSRKKENMYCTGYVAHPFVRLRVLRLATAFFAFRALPSANSLPPQVRFFEYERRGQHFSSRRARPCKMKLV